MGYSIFKYGCPMLTDIENLEKAKGEGLSFVASTESEYLEIRDSDNETVTIAEGIGVSPGNYEDSSNRFLKDTNVGSLCVSTLRDACVTLDTSPIFNC